MKVKFIPVLALAVLFSCFGKTEGIKEKDIIGLQTTYLYLHAKYRYFDDEISERTLNNYLLTLDYGKYYFYKSDIEKYQKYSKQLDDMAMKEDYSLIYDIFDCYKKRFDEMMKLADELISGRFDFNTDETINTDRESEDYAADKKEMKDRWRKNIKLQLMNYTAAGETTDSAKEKLRRKYRHAEKQINEITKTDILARYMNSWTLALDPHSSYHTAEENEDFKISMELKLEGIGARLRSDDGFVTIESLIPGGASDKIQGPERLMPNDRITAVSQDGKEWTDIIDMDLRDAVKLIRGKKNTPVHLTIMRDSAESDKPECLTVTITREEIQLRDSEAKACVKTIGSGKDAVKIGYIHLPSFYQDSSGNKSSAGDMKKLIKQLAGEKIRGLIVDLRGNPGGLLNESVEIAGYFIDEGPVLQVTDYRNIPAVYSDNDSGTEYDGPLVLLIDRFSASASEILAGAMKDYRRALIIGSSSSFGKGTVQSYREIDEGMGAIRVTTNVFYQPGGKSNQLNGIQPDVVIPDINSVWDIGENRARYPLKWTPVPSASFKPVNMVSPAMVSALQKKSSDRIKKDSEYVQLQEKINKLKIQVDKKTISLKEESTMEKTREKELEKTLRDDSRETADLKKDLFLREAFNVTKDYIALTKKQTQGKE